jgi:hypothetical protein
MAALADQSPGSAPRPAASTRWFAEDPHDVVTAMGTDADDGLSAAEAARRLSEHGPNELTSEPPPSRWVIALAQVRDPMNLMLVAVTVVSLVVGGATTAILLGGTDVEGESVEIAGDSLAGSQIAKDLGVRAALPARYEAVHLEAIASRGDLAQMFRWFAQRPAYRADFDATRALVPDVLDLTGRLAAWRWHLAGRA